MICIVCGSTDFSICNGENCEWEEDLPQLIERWCNTHQRDYKRCLSREGGIMLPCRPIICKEIGIEIWDDKNGVK